MKRLHLVASVALLAAAPMAPRPVAAQEGLLAADAIYHNGRILTVNERFDVAEALAVAAGRIVAVGTLPELRSLQSDRTRMVDLDGATMLPGFYDNHIHPGRGGHEFQAWRGGWIPYHPAPGDWTRGVGTMDELLESLRRRADEVPTGEWIWGALSRPDWPNQKLPTRRELDRMAPDNPVFLSRGSHRWVLNSRGLERLGIDRNTPDPDGGEFLRDEDGVPTGVVSEARRLRSRVLPAGTAALKRIYDLDRETAIEVVRRQMRQLVQVGITSVNIAGIRPHALGIFQELYRRHGDVLPRATIQIRVSPGYDTYDDLEVGVRETISEIEGLGLRTGWGDERLKVGAIKMSIDGGMSAPVFWSTEPYEGRPDFHGVLRIPAEAFRPVAKRAHELGWQLGIHAIGDAAVVMVVDELEKILRDSPRPNHRHYLHHVSVKPPLETIEKMAELGIGVASQPSFTASLGAYAVEALQEDREATQNPGRSLLDRGVWMSYGSDALPYGPLFAIWTAVTRTGWDGRTYGPAEAVPLEEAIRIHTMGSAFQTFDEDTRGSLEPGKMADLVVLAENPLSVEPARIKDVRVIRTIIGGREVYGPEQAAPAR